jgi:type IV fimbrial biogenesis protein FimT
MTNRSNTINQGFTLIELLMTMAIASIILSIGIPAFKQTINTNRKATQVNQLLHSLNVARSEAVMRGFPVSACKSDDGSTCGSSGVKWNDGWIVFLDDDMDGDHREATDGNGTLNTNEEILQVIESMPNGYSIKADNFSGSLTYQPEGYIVDSNRRKTSGYFVVCLDNDINGAGAVFINIAGKARSGRDLNHNHIPEDIGGTDITTCSP